MALLAVYLGKTRETRASFPALRSGRRRRWRRPLPFVFLTIFALVTIGAALYPPNNYDALTYRIPQVLHWLAKGRWHWIPVSDPHINVTPPGYGWFMAPAIALFHTDRFFALPNLIAFALLPGLYFSVLRQCGVSGRVAWMWMWLLPAASCFAMQAGGIGNDLLPAVYALAAVALGFHAARRREMRDFWLSALAAAIGHWGQNHCRTGGFGVGGGDPARCSGSSFRQRWLGSLAIAGLALLISYLPTAITNAVYTGSWSGDPTNRMKLRVDSPVSAVVGNSLMILTGALGATSLQSHWQAR